MLPGSIGENMTTARKSRHFGRTELAKAAGVPHATLRNAEYGNGHLSVLQLISCAAVLKMSLDEYVGYSVER